MWQLDYLPYQRWHVHNCNDDPDADVYNDSKSIEKRIGKLLLDVSLDDISHEDWTCGICKEPYLVDPDDPSREEEQPVLVSCNHILGKSCIKSWFAQSTLCPLCRQTAQQKTRIAGVWKFVEECLATDWWHRPSRDWDGKSWPEVTPPWLAQQLRLDGEILWKREPTLSNNDVEFNDEILGQELETLTVWLLQDLTTFK